MYSYPSSNFFFSRLGVAAVIAVSSSPAVTACLAVLSVVPTALSDAHSMLGIQSLFNFRSRFILLVLKEIAGKITPTP
jgi:hypothetical protein